MQTTKTCTKCGETRPLDRFHKQRGCKYGVRPTCKPCGAEYQRRYREANRDKVAGWDRRYYEKNRDKIAERDRRYREKNPEKVAEMGRRWREANPDYNHRHYETHRDEIREQHRRYYGENRKFGRVKSAKRQRETQELTEVFATVLPGTPWTSEEETLIMADNGMTLYEKAVQLGRTYGSCDGKRQRLRKKLGVSPGDH